MSAYALPISDLIGNDHSLVYKYRRGPALLSFVLPAAFIWLCIAILSDKGGESFSQFLLARNGFGLPGLVGIGACIIWCWRYCRPALSVMAKRGYAVYADGDGLHFFGRVFQLSEINGYRIEKSLFRDDIMLVAGERKLASGSQIFIELEY